MFFFEPHCPCRSDSQGSGPPEFLQLPISEVDQSLGIFSGVRTYLLERLNEKGANTNTIYIQQVLTSEKGINTLLRSVGEADIIILASPLYADSHHSCVIAAMELIHQNLKNKPVIKKRIMVAISNSGFPNPGTMIYHLQ